MRRHYAIVNPFHPDVERPAAIARVGWSGEQRLTSQGEWVPTTIVSDITHGNSHSTLLPLTEQDAARLVAEWPDQDSSRVRYFAWSTADGHLTAVMRAWNLHGTINEESYVDGWWIGRQHCVFDDEQRWAEVDSETAERLGKVLDQRVEGGGPENGRYDHYYAIMDNDRKDVSAARGLVRTWGGSDGHSYEQHFLTRIDRWRWCMTVHDIRNDRNRNYAVPISEEVAEELRRVWLAAVAAREAGEEPVRTRPLGKWTGVTKVAFTQVDDELLDTVRQVGDPWADSAVAAVHRFGEIEQVNALLPRFVHNGDEVPAGLPLLLRQYFAASALPAWAEREVLARGQELWDLYGPHLAAALCCYALPVRYGMALQHTHPGLESTRLLRDVLAGGGLSEPGGRGLRAVQKVRLRQAATRRLVGVGVANQEDLAATAGTLSVHLARGLVASRVALPERDRDDLFHIWSVVGHVLGVDLRLLPGTYDEAVALMGLIGRRRRTRSVVGAELTEALERRVEAALPPELAGAFPGLVRSFCVHDPQVPDLVGIPEIDQGRWLEHLEPIAAAAGLPAHSIVDDLVWRRRTSEFVGEALLRADREEDLALPGA